MGTPKATTDRPDLAVKMDYSDTYRENDVLDEVLEERLDELHKNRYRMWTEKSSQLRQIRRQVEVIVRLRNAVNGRRPGDSYGIVSRSPRRTKAKTKATPKMEEHPVDTVDVDDIAKATKMQAWISTERNKYSAKNLFNVQRMRKEFGHVHESSNPALKAYHRKRHSVANSKPNGFEDLQTTSLPVEREKPNLDAATTRVTGIERPKSAFALQGNRPNSSRFILAKNKRPKTAVEIRQADTKASTHARRSRSRRELELLCRTYYDDDETEVVGDDFQQWDVVKESQRKQRLEQLLNEREQLNLRVQHFLDELGNLTNLGGKRKSLNYVISDK